MADGTGLGTPLPGLIRLCAVPAPPGSLRKNSFCRRLLKKVQIQGAVTHLRWVPAEARGVLGYPFRWVRTSQRRTHRDDGYPA
jgi:hypothetical protein